MAFSIPFVVCTSVAVAFSIQNVTNPNCCAVQASDWFFASLRCFGILQMLAHAMNELCRYQLNVPCVQVGSPRTHTGPVYNGSALIRMIVCGLRHGTCFLAVVEVFQKSVTSLCCAGFFPKKEARTCCNGVGFSPYFSMITSFFLYANGVFDFKCMILHVPKKFSNNFMFNTRIMQRSVFKDTPYILHYGAIPVIRC